MDDVAGETKVIDYLYSSNPSHLFNTTKLILDVENNKYDKVFINETEVDLSAYTPVTAANSNTPQISIALIIKGRTGVSDITYLDGFVFTIDEP